MGAYENPQIGIVDYTLGQKAFDSAFTNMYTVFSNYYANIDKEKKAINKEIKNAWDPSKTIVANSADAGIAAVEGIYTGGNNAKEYFSSIGKTGPEMQDASRQYVQNVEIVGNLFNRVYIDQESEFEFDKSDPLYEKYKFIHDIMTNNNMGGRNINFDFIEPEEGVSTMGHKYFDANITLQNKDGSLVNNKRFGIKDGVVSLDELNRMYKLMDTNKVNHKAIQNQFNTDLANKSLRIKTLIADDIANNKINTLHGHLNTATNELLNTPASIDSYYANNMTVGDRMTGGVFGLNKEDIVRPMTITVNDKDYKLPREFFQGAITREKIIAMFNDAKLGDFDSLDGISVEEDAMINAALEYRDNVAKAHLWRKLSIGQKDSYAPEPEIIENELNSWQNKIMQAQILNSLNEKKFADRLMGNDDSPIFVGTNVYKWRGMEITKEIYDPISGTMDFELKVSSSTHKVTAKEAWAALSQEEKNIYDDQAQFIENYKGSVKHSVIKSTLSKELGRSYRLWDENDVNELLKILAVRNDAFSTIQTEIEAMGNYPNMVARTIYDEIMSDASLFDDKTGVPTDEGWKEIENILPRGAIGSYWYNLGEKGLSITDKNQILKLIKQMRNK